MAGFEVITEVSAQKIGEWSVVLIRRLKKECERGEDIEVQNDGDEPYDPDDYEEWVSESQTLVEITTDFSEWSGWDEPEELLRLRHLIDSVERPPDLDVPGDEVREYSGPSSPSSYWTLERMFEDL
jgi:hypothetical protein